MNRHPLQDIEKDADGRIRFVENAIVRYLLDAGPFDMNRLGLMPFSNEDWEQFAQLIGYSVSGFGDLSYASDEAVNEADAKAAEIMGMSEPKEEIEPQKFHYFVSFVASAKPTGALVWGNTDVRRKSPIASQDDIEELQEDIEDAKPVIANVVIQGWRLFDKREGE